MQRAQINSAEWDRYSRELMQAGLLEAETKLVLKKGWHGKSRHRLSADPPVRTVTLYKTTKQGVAYFVQRTRINAGIKPGARMLLARELEHTSIRL
jgi:hypothetical protein